MRRLLYTWRITPPADSTFPKLAWTTVVRPPEFPTPGDVIVRYEGEGLGGPIITNSGEWSLHAVSTGTQVSLKVHLQLRLGEIVARKGVLGQADVEARLYVLIADRLAGAFLGATADDDSRVMLAGFLVLLSITRP